MRLTREFLTSPLVGANGVVYGVPGDRFLSRLKVEGGCLVWGGGRKDNGYGQMGIGNNRTVYTHRIAWALAEGVLEDDDLVLHRCDNPPCCKPEHLFLGTHKSNSDDKIAKGRFRPGAPRPPTDPGKVALIQRLRATGLKPPGIGRAVNLSATQVRNILRKYGEAPC